MSRPSPCLPGPAPVSSRGGRALLACVLVALVCISSPVAAATGAADKADKRKARLLLKEGDRFFLDGELELALARYEAAHALYPASGTLRRVGEVFVALRRHAEAREAFEKYLVAAPKGAWRRAVEAHVAELEVILSTRFVITSDPEGATVYVDSKVDGALGETPLETNLVPGPHRVYLEAEYHEPHRGDIDAAAGGTTEVHVTMVPTPARLTVISSPSMAVALVDGVRVGRTPVTTTLPPGEHVIVVSKETYQRFEVRLTAAGHPLRVEATLTRPPRAPSTRRPPPPTEPPPEPEKELRERTEHSHAGKLLISITYRDEVLTRLDAGVFEVGYGISDLFEVQAGVMLGTWGGRARLRAFPIGRRGPFKLTVAVEVPVFNVRGEGVVLAGGGTVGFQWDMDSHFGFFLEAGADYAFVRPDGSPRGFLVAAGGAEVRLP